MAEKITCPDCGFEFDIGEGYKKHLKALEVKTRADVEKKNKAAFEIKLRQEKKKVSVESEAKVKAEKEKTDKFQKELLAEKQKRKEIDKQYKDHYANLADAKIKASKETSPNTGNLINSDSSYVVVAYLRSSLGMVIKFKI